MKWKLLFNFFGHFAHGIIILSVMFQKYNKVRNYFCF